MTDLRALHQAAIKDHKGGPRLDAYAPNLAQRFEIYASPLQATAEQMKGLAPGWTPLVWM